MLSEMAEGGTEVWEMEEVPLRQAAKLIGRPC